MLQMQGVWGCSPPEADAIYIKVTFSILLNSYDNTMAYYVSVYEAFKIVNCGFIFLPRGSIIS